MRSSSRLKVSTCSTYSWWAISSLIGVGLRITFYRAWRTNSRGRGESRGVEESKSEKGVEVLDMQREGEGERRVLGSERQDTDFGGRRYEITKRIRGFGSEWGGLERISQMREQEREKLDLAQGRGWKREKGNRCERASTVDNNQRRETEAEVAGVIFLSDISLVQRHIPAQR